MTTVQAVKLTRNKSIWVIRPVFLFNGTYITPTIVLASELHSLPGINKRVVLLWAVSADIMSNGPELLGVWFLPRV